MPRLVMRFLIFQFWKPLADVFEEKSLRSRLASAVTAVRDRGTFDALECASFNQHFLLQQVEADDVE